MKQKFDYIELPGRPGGIRMVTKNPIGMSVEEHSQSNPNQERTGGSADWQLPTLENCETLHEYIIVNGNVLNFEDGWIEAVSEKDTRTYAFNVFTGEKRPAESFWPRDLCWVVLV
jgi:hypothetical protein